MSPAFLGICLGIVNVIANALLFATLGDEPAIASFVISYGMVPGIIAGSLIGALAGATATAPRVSRLLVLACVVTVVILLLAAGFLVTNLVPLSLAPTLVCCVILEARTRKDPFAAATPEITRGSGMKVSMLLGPVVMFIVLVGMLAKENDLNYLAQLYLPWGLLCGLALAAPFGVIADQTRNWTTLSRRLALLASALALTIAVGKCVRMESLILMAFIPVAAGCMLLERYTRVAPTVPTAIARTS